MTGIFLISIFHIHYSHIKLIEWQQATGNDIFGCAAIMKTKASTENVNETWDIEFQL